MKIFLILITTLGIATAAWAGQMHGGKPSFGKMMFEKMDANEDGVITTEEHEASIQQMIEKRSEHFTKMDADGDGSVTKEEAKAARESMREKMGKGMGGDMGEKRRECMGDKDE